MVSDCPSLLVILGAGTYYPPPLLARSDDLKGLRGEGHEGHESY